MAKEEKDFIDTDTSSDKVFLIKDVLKQMQDEGDDELNKELSNVIDTFSDRDITTEKGDIAQQLKKVAGVEKEEKGQKYDSKKKLSDIDNKFKEVIKRDLEKDNIEENKLNLGDVTELKRTKLFNQIKIDFLRSLEYDYDKLSKFLVKHGYITDEGDQLLIKVGNKEFDYEEVFFDTKNNNKALKDLLKTIQEEIEKDEDFEKIELDFESEKYITDDLLEYEVLEKFVEITKDAKNYIENLNKLQEELRSNPDYKFSKIAEKILEFKYDIKLDDEKINSVISEDKKNIEKCVSGISRIQNETKNMFDDFRKHIDKFYIQEAWEPLTKEDYKSDKITLDGDKIVIKSSGKNEPVITKELKNKINSKLKLLEKTTGNYKNVLENLQKGLKRINNEILVLTNDYFMNISSKFKPELEIMFDSNSLFLRSNQKVDNIYGWANAVFGSMRYLDLFQDLEKNLNKNKLDEIYSEFNDKDTKEKTFDLLLEKSKNAVEAVVKLVNSNNKAEARQKMLEIYEQIQSEINELSINSDDEDKFKKKASQYIDNLFKELYTVFIFKNNSFNSLIAQVENIKSNLVPLLYYSGGISYVLSYADLYKWSWGADNQQFKEYLRLVGDWTNKTFADIARMTNEASGSGQNMFLIPYDIEQTKEKNLSAALAFKNNIKEGKIDDTFKASNVLYNLLNGKLITLFDVINADLLQDQSRESNIEENQPEITLSIKEAYDNWRQNKTTENLRILVKAVINKKDSNEEVSDVLKAQKEANTILGNRNLAVTVDDVIEQIALLNDTSDKETKKNVEEIEKSLKSKLKKRDIGDDVVLQLISSNPNQSLLLKEIALLKATSKEVQDASTKSWIKEKTKVLSDKFIEEQKEYETDLAIKLFDASIPSEHSGSLVDIRKETIEQLQQRRSEYVELINSINKELSQKIGKEISKIGFYK